MSTFVEWFGGQRLALLRLATVLADDRQTAQDVVQEVALRAHSRWDRVQTMAYPEAYLRRMVVNEYLSWRRKWGRIVPVGQLDDAQVSSAPDHAEQIADRQQLRREMAALPARQRAVLVLRYYEGFDDATIAELLGTRTATVRAYASRALTRLRITIPAEPALRPLSAATIRKGSHEDRR